MFGSHGLPETSRAASKHAAARTALAVAAAAAAIFAVASVAHAEDCVGGYRMLKGEIPVVCQTGQPRAMFSTAQSSAREPLYTGSINRTGVSSAATTPAASGATASTNDDAMCVNGMRYVTTPNNGATLMMKCS